MKIYIAGPITNHSNYLAAFKRAMGSIEANGHVPLNPVKPLGFHYKDYIDMGICELMHCDAVLMLQGWETSPGACLEKKYAETVGLKIYYEDNKSRTRMSRKG